MHPPVGSNHCPPCSLQPDHNRTVDWFLLYTITHILHTHAHTEDHEAKARERKNYISIYPRTPLVSQKRTTFSIGIFDKMFRELTQHTWKKSSCFSGLQKNGCLSTQAVEGRDSASALIICLIRF